MNPEPCIEKGHAWLRNCNVHEFVDKMKGCFFSVIPAPPCHPRRLSSTSLIEDLNRGSSVFLLYPSIRSDPPGTELWIPDTRCRE